MNWICSVRNRAALGSAVSALAILLSVGAAQAASSVLAEGVTNETIRADASGFLEGAVSGTDVQGLFFSLGTDSTTEIIGGLVSIQGGPTQANGGGTVSTLNVGNAALQVVGGAVMDNGLIVRDGFIANNGTTLNGGAVVNGGLTAHGQTTVDNFAVTNGSTVSMGNNVVHDVAPGVAGTDAVNVNQLNSSLTQVNSAIVDTNRRIDKVTDGVAIALAIQNPILTGNDKFGVSFNWGGFDGSNAFGFAAAGILAQNAFGSGEKFGLTGGVGVTDNDTVAGRAGVQFTW